MMLLGQGIEWGGDVLDGLPFVAVAAAVVTFGFAWGRWRALLAVVLVTSIPPAAGDLLYFGLGADIPGYCGEPKCDPGPIPWSYALIVVLPAPLALTAVGVFVRRRRGIA